MSRTRNKYCLNCGETPKNCECDLMSLDGCAEPIRLNPDIERKLKKIRDKYRGKSDQADEMVDEIFRLID